MTTNTSKLHFWIEAFFAKLGFGMRAKLIILFVVIKVIPLGLLALLAYHQAQTLGYDMIQRTGVISTEALDSLVATGDLAIEDATKALDERATEDIERITTDIAQDVASFLYARDDDLRFMATLEPNTKTYQDFLNTQTSPLIKPSEWILSEDGKEWVRKNELATPKIFSSSNQENNTSFKYRPPDQLEFEAKPLFLEATFVDLNGMEQIKVTTSDLMNPKLQNVADKANTFCKAEDYFSKLKELQPGEIYVSDVIGEYVGSKIIGMYTPENAAKRNVPYEPENAAFAGTENPNGKRFKGIVRWATPVERDGAIIGYVTLALNHDHILALVEHIRPTSERYTELSDGFTGNYAFIWDYKGRSVAHPRHHSMYGFDATTGNPQIPWLESSIYNAWQASGKPYEEFIVDYPTFFEQSNSKKPALELAKQGLIGLDCRYLNFAPQCVGWFDLTQDGGSGSFLILWSGLWKLNTAAAIPYYTGHYADSPRGFGFVAVGANVDDFHLAATETEETLNVLLNESDQKLARLSKEAFESINQSLWQSSLELAGSTAVMTLLVIIIAIWMASTFTNRIDLLIQGITKFRSGFYQSRFNASIKDEIGNLADAIDDMADSISENFTTAVSILSLDRTICYANEASLALIDAKLDDVVGKKYDEMAIYPWNTKYCPLTALLEGTEPEVMYYAKTDQYLKGQATFLKDPQGENIGYIISITDVTDILLEQNRIEQQRMLLDTIIMSSPDIISYKDNSGKYLSVNPRFASLVGKTPEEICGKVAEDIFSATHARDITTRDKQTIDSAKSLTTESQLHFADGHTETVDVVRTPLFDIQENVVGILSVARDVSMRVATENALRKAKDELLLAVTAARKANEAKTTFLANMSHETRTPMNAIIGMATITKRKLNTGEEPLAVMPHVDQIESSAVHLLALLNDVLEISQIETGKLSLTPEPFDIKQLIDDIANTIRLRCQTKDIDFTVAVEGIEATDFNSDPLRLRQVLLNLLGNAVKFTPEKGNVTLRIHQQDRKDGKALLGFHIIDTGIGISQKGMESLFVPFEQGGKDISRTYGGTGLGLSISRSIVNLFGGDITVNSKEGVGSEFTFTIWLDECPNQKSSQQEAVDLSLPAGKRVLLVDDVDINRLIVTELLSPFELEIDEAVDGIDAIEKFIASSVGYYDVILMDIQMPRLDGHDASKRIRELNRADAATVPIIAITANAFKEDVEAALASGMNTHLAKPIELEKLILILKGFLSA